MNAVKTRLAMTMVACALIVAPAFAAGGPSVKVTITGSLNATFTTSDFGDLYLGAGNLKLEIQRKKPFGGEVDIFINVRKPGTYAIRGTGAKGHPKTGFQFVCDTMNILSSQPACSQYDSHIRGTLKLTHIGNYKSGYYSGSFDVNARDGKGHHVHLVGTFNHIKVRG